MSPPPPASPPPRRGRGKGGGGTPRATCAHYHGSHQSISLPHLRRRASIQCRPGIRAAKVDSPCSALYEDARFRGRTLHCDDCESCDRAIWTRVPIYFEERNRDL